MITSTRLTSRDLEVLPQDGKRYEIIDGELYVTHQPHYRHQDVGGLLYIHLQEWSLRTGAGRASPAPGVIFAEDDDVAPDVVWTSTARLREILGEDGHLHGPPELVVEVLSPGSTNERRDREAKLKLYSRRGVDEYWIVDWRAREIEVYRRAESGEPGQLLDLAERLSGDGALTSPLLPGFAVPVSNVFADPLSD